jgi:5-enolpyruvylshikimate-3-phosphate synthase
MSLLPLPKGIGDIDVKATVAEFLELLRSMNAKLDILIDIERGGGRVEAPPSLEGIEFDPDDPSLQAEAIHLPEEENQP